MPPAVTRRRPACRKRAFAPSSATPQLATGLSRPLHPSHAGLSAHRCDPKASEPFVDAETGFVYLRARYYDPATGQFMSRDPLTAMTGAPYSYVDGNPLNGTDPLGLFSVTGFARQHWRGIAQGLAVASLVVAVAALPVAVGAFVVLADSGLAASLPVAAAAGWIGLGSTGLSMGSTYVTCKYGSESACSWAERTTIANGGGNILGHFLPITGALAGIASSVAGLTNPHWQACPSVDNTRNPDGSYVSGGVSPNMDAAGVPVDPRQRR